MQLIIYTEIKTPRLEYVLNVFIKQLLGIDYQLVDDKFFFQGSSLPKINYSRKKLPTEAFFIPSTALLFEKGIKFQSIKPFKFNELTAFFYTSVEESDLPFDIFAIVFYLLSRYEEYLPSQKDVHDRFVATKSLAYQSNFLQQPLINLWSLQFKNILGKMYPQLQFSLPNYQFLPTYDIDFAWAYRHKGFLRSLGAYVKDILRGDMRILKERFLVQTNQLDDPFYTFDYLEELQKKYQLNPLYFFLLGNHAEFDKNISPNKPIFQRLIWAISQKNDIGIHPSYKSNTAFSILKMEKERLEKISQQLVVNSRQHFLKLTLPDTYRNLIKIGIQNDYTMGYAAQIGFRASIATPFYWYDLKAETTTNLLIHPFQIMDVTLQQYLQLSPNAAIEKALEIIQITKSVNGTFVTLWHNSSFSKEEKWRDWKRVYEAILAAAQ